MSKIENNKTDAANIRPPVVVVLGHVDHGKTTILDTIRKTKIAAKEAGGITQHIGAYQIEHNSKRITFLDTPGHEAFSAIRSRGTKVADIAILVVAADEGIKPQTKEAIAIIKQTEIPFIVAINKIDKDGANPQKVRQELAEVEVFVEDYGGKIPVVEISAKNDQGLDTLLELILLTAELEELKFSQTKPAQGVVIESHLDKRRGMVATVLVADGALKITDWIVAGKTFGRVKAMFDFNGKNIESATASDPVVILGWEDAPELGAGFLAVDSSEEAQTQARIHAMETHELFIRESSAVPRSNKKFLNLIIKADVASSLEAIDQILKTIPTEEIGYNTTSYGVGNIGDSDIKNAVATKSLIVGFNVDTDSATTKQAEREGVAVQTFTIIYELVEFIREVMSNLIEPEINRVPLGKLKVLAVFKKEAKNQIIGGRIISGKAVRGAKADIVRGDKILVAGRIGQLQNKKQDMSEVTEGNEAGIRFDMPAQKSGDMPVIIRVGDVLDIYEEENIKRSI